jgi:hypothetical protein
MTFMRINPRHWALTSYNLGDVVITHEPTQVTDDQAEALRLLKKGSLPLVVEVDAPEQPKPKRVAVKPASDKEDVSTSKKLSGKASKDD